MNSALIRFVAGYLADHAARAEAGDGARGRVQIDAQLGSCLELRFEANRCHVASRAPHMSSFIALSFSGRFSVMTAMLFLDS